MTVKQFLASEKEPQVLAVRDRWNVNASEPTLGKMVAAARASQAEPEAIVAIYECTKRVASKNKETMKVFKELDIRDAHKLAEPEGLLNDVVDVCMVMVMALSEEG